MSRIPLPLYVGDMSQFARALGKQLSGLERAPKHVELLHMLSKANGFRNFQHYKAQQEAAGSVPREKSATPPDLNEVLVRRIIRYFDAAGVLSRWPKKYSHQGICLWVLWARIPARQVFHEQELNGLLRAMHAFGDHALLRRELVDRGLMRRTADGREYRRLERRPSPEAVAVIREVVR